MCSEKIVVATRPSPRVPFEISDDIVSVIAIKRKEKLTSNYRVKYETISSKQMHNYVSSED